MKVSGKWGVGVALQIKVSLYLQPWARKVKKLKLHCAKNQLKIN